MQLVKVQANEATLIKCCAAHINCTFEDNFVVDTEVCYILTVMGFTLQSLHFEKQGHTHTHTTDSTE